MDSYIGADTERDRHTEILRQRERQGRLDSYIGTRQIDRQTDRQIDRYTDSL